ncbi:MAG: hypothetical protein LM601_05435 [Candidatus Verstraetearchaeota archaeon]|jgi:hypothetical protein|nr:hypothetical protein [Candidatus Verstraetearchaeota archaeon]
MKREYVAIMISTIIIAILTCELLNMNLVASKEIMINEDENLERIIKALNIGEGGQWPEGYTGFEFTVVGLKGNYLIVKVTKIHGMSGINVGDILYMSIPQKILECMAMKKPPINQPLKVVKDLGYIVIKGMKLRVCEVKPLQETGTYPIYGTIEPGQLNFHGYHYLYTTQRVDISCKWNPAYQPIDIGIVYWAYRHFYYYRCYGGCAEVHIYPPYEGWYSIGIGNPMENSEAINYDGYYILNPAE